MTENELRTLCRSLGYSVAHTYRDQPAKERYQAVTNDGERKTIYICKASALPTLTAEEVKEKLAKYTPDQQQLTITQSGDVLVLSRGDDTRRGNIRLLLHPDEVEMLRAYLCPPEKPEEPEEAKREAYYKREGELQRMTVPALRDEAKAHGLRVYARTTKPMLIEMILRHEGHIV
jgi:hypothetical protein